MKGTQMALLDDMSDAQKAAFVEAIIAFRNLWNSGRLTDRQRGTELLAAVENLRAAMSPPEPFVPPGATGSTGPTGKTGA